MSGGRGRGGQGALELSDLGGGSGVRANEVPGTECLEKSRRRTKGVLRDISQEKRRPRNESPCFALILRGMASRRASERGCVDISLRGVSRNFYQDFDMETIFRSAPLIFWMTWSRGARGSFSFLFLGRI